MVYNASVHVKWLTSPATAPGYGRRCEPKSTNRPEERERGGLLNITTEWEIAKVPPDDERRVLVERIVTSRRFHRAPQLRDILVYVAARSMSQNPATLTEHEIGSTVLGRGQDFDPGHDNIVRAQMRHLRIKLEEYFENEGKDEALVLSIPKGHYVASFSRRPPAQPKVAPAPPPTEAAPPRRRWAGVALVLIAVTLAILLLRGKLQEPAVSVPKGYAFYSDILGPHDGQLAQTSLVLGNPVVILYAGAPTPDGKAIGATESLPVPADWQERLRSAANRADLAMPHHLLQVKTNDYTGLGDATGCFHLGQLMKILARPTTITQSRFLTWDSAMRRTLIILGSPHTNEWAHGNVPDHNFRIVKMGVVNQDPAPGESDLYRCVWDENGIAILDHGLIWGWRTPSGSRVLVLAGPSSAATGAMAGLFADAESFRPIHEKLRSGNPGGEFPANWQALFKIEIRDNLPVRTTYVTHRVYPSDS